ncbi:MAG TPA: alanine--tRNA ligase [Gemmatimonadaceae bacterium]|jgi:alanyl-tRNA synthetase
MHAAEIRRRFLAYFARQNHAIRPSSSLVPADDPTLLFTNAGMVQFKKIFLGSELAPDGNRRATTSQKCVRAGGKHNDLEQVGHTARHHTFFEMLGNFSFGDYFKRDAIRFAWEFVTEDLKIPKEHLRVSVFHEDDEARALWREVANLPDSRIYGLGAADNFWQMADTGPCGPCTEIYVDLAHLAKDFAFPAGAKGEWTETARTEFSTDAFVEGAEAGRFLEIWNLVFMQFDRQGNGEMIPLPKPSVDTGAGLERIAAVLQGVSNNYHTDLFMPYIEAVEKVVGIKYVYAEERSAGFRVIADHARAVAFLLADGVFPSNDGRGYVLRRILRRAVRHAWLLGRREPTLVFVVEKVIEQLREVFPELHVRKKHILDTTRAEEERFLSTIDGGMARFEEIAPVAGTQRGREIRGTISGDDAFRLYDTFGFPIDLTELMARERGYTVDIAGFETSLAGQRKQSQDERKSRRISVVIDDLADMSKWETTATGPHAQQPQRFVGYETTEAETRVLAVRRLDDNRVAVVLRETPFYAESGGQVSDIGEIVGVGSGASSGAWRVDVDDVKKVDGRIAAIGTLTGSIVLGDCIAKVPPARRRDITRNHTATHLLHAALRRVLGEHVHQAGSVVEPDRLRFDFTHHGPLTRAQIADVERWANEGIWQNNEVQTTEKKYADAVAQGAMALFGEKYGDVVRVVEIPHRSTELCGGTHVRNTGHILMCRIVSESGVSAGVRRIVAVTGPKAYELLRDREGVLESIGERLKVNVHAVTHDVIEKKLDQLIAEKKTLEKKLEEALKGGGGAASGLLAGAERAGNHTIVARTVKAGDVKELQALGDSVREAIGSGVGVLGAAFEDGKATLLIVVGDPLRDRSVSANDLVKAFGSKTGARGGGKPHMAQAGIAADDLDAAIATAAGIVRLALETVA